MHRLPRFLRSQSNLSRRFVDSIPKALVESYAELGLESMLVLGCNEALWRLPDFAGIAGQVLCMDADCEQLRVTGGVLRANRTSWEFACMDDEGDDAGLDLENRRLQQQGDSGRALLARLPRQRGQHRPGTFQSVAMVTREGRLSLAQIGWLGLMQRRPSVKVGCVRAAA